ncbi:MAG TPA: type II secretion system protein N [Allosphingosinicella sp.]|nr:type II secretion system protein N [Allosphingosinicella sp.]
MRIRLPLGRTLFLAAAFLFALVALLPLRLVLGGIGFDERGLTARAATGSVWRGALQEAQIGPVALGDVKARLNLLPLLLGRARLSLAGADPATPFEGAASLSRHSFGFEDVTGRFRLGALSSPVPLTSLDFQDVSAGFASGRCTRAEGRVRAAVAGEVAGIGLASGLSGNPRCADDALLLPLASQSGMEQLNIRLFADGRYRLDLFVRSADEAIRARLLAAGLRPVGRGFGMRVDGRF